MEGFPSNGKRKADTVQNDASKQQRVESNVQSNNPTKITDVNQFCLEKIFTYLDVKDLLNVANANKDLQLVTHSPYARQHAKKTIYIMLQYNRFGEKLGSSNQYDISNANIKDTEKTILITDFKTALQMLRCFGHTFVDISLYYCSQYPKSQKVNRLMSYIHEFCANSLTKIQINTGVPFEEFKKTFPNVETVKLSDSLSGNNDMNMIFPKLRRLICCNLCDPGSITPVHCPNLEHLKFNNKNVEVMDENKQTIADILRLNPQLRSFTIDLNHFDVLNFIVEYLQSIESLHIIHYIRGLYKGSPIMWFPNVKSLTLEIHGHLTEIPLLLNRLEELTIKGHSIWGDRYQTSEEMRICDFIKGHQSIQKITIETERLIYPLNCSKLIEALPTLQNINIIPQIGGEHLTLDIVLHYLPIFKWVQSFYFEALNCFISEDDIRKKCSKEWHVTCVKAKRYNHFTLRPIDRPPGKTVKIGKITFFRPSPRFPFFQH